MRVRASGGSGGAIRARDLQMCVTMYICMWARLRVSACTCICVCVPIPCKRVRVCARVCACLRERRERRRNLRSRPLAMCPYVHTYVGMSEPICTCKRAYIEYMSARMCVCVCACERASGAALYMHACIDGSALTGVHRYACICVYIERYLYHYYTSIIYSYACIMYGPIAALCTQVPMSVGTQTDRHRRVHVCLAPSVQPNI